MIELERYISIQKIGVIFLKKLKTQLLQENSV